MRRKPSRPWSHRLTALFLAVLFSLAGAREGIAGYVCTRHAGHDHATHAGHAPATHAEHASAADDASHDHTAHRQSVRTDHAGPTADGHDQPEPCDCIGDCQPGQPSARAAIEPATVVVPGTPADCLTSTEAARLPGAPKFLLPFSNGPPSLG